MEQKDAPIGVFDSGVGGISVLRVLREELPQEDFVFYGDSANAPYGEKGEAEIRRLSEHCLHFLLSHHCKACVIACNTATSAAADWLRQSYPDTIIVGMEPAVKPAVLKNAYAHPKVLVMATASTLSGERLRHLLELHEDKGEIFTLPSPGIVRLLEAGKEDSPQLRTYLRDILSPYRLHTDGHVEKRIDSIVLGCTHFSFVQKQIQDAMGYPVSFFDGALGTARQTRRRLSEAGLLSERERPGEIRLYTSRTDPSSLALSERLLRLS